MNEVGPPVLDLSDPMIRRLYDALCGRREPDMDEKHVMLSVLHDRVCHRGRASLAKDVLGPETTEDVWLLIERATNIDAEGTRRRMERWMEAIAKAPN